MAETLSSEQYSATLIDHFNHPRNAGRMEDADAEAFVTNPVCGDSMRIFLRFDEDGGHIAAASFLSSGCPASIATSSLTRKETRNCASVAGMLEGSSSTFMTVVLPGKGGRLHREEIVDPAKDILGRVRCRLLLARDRP